MSNLDLGKQPLGSKSKYTVYLRNKGDLPGELRHFEVQPASAAENFEVSTTCKILQGKSAEVCPFQVSFAPTGLGDVNASLVVTYDDGQGQLLQTQLPLKGAANNLAFLKFDPETLDLKTDTIGYSVTSTLKVIYNGAHVRGAATGIKPAMGVVISDPTNSQFSVDPAGTTCGSTINADCVIKVIFAASSVGPQTASLNLSYFNGSESLKIGASLQGTGLAAVILGSLSGAANTSFGNVVYNPATAPVLNIPVTFNGSVPVNNVKITGPSAGSAFTLNMDKAVSTCLASTTINGNCTLSVTFNPTARKAYTDQIGFTYTSNNQSQPAVTLGLSGNGVNPAQITLSTNALAFGSVPAYQPQSRSVTLTNTGEAAVSMLSALTSSNTTDFSTALGASCASLGGGATCSLTVNFKPLSAAALRTNLSFTYFDGRATQKVQLAATGTGTAPAVMTGGGTIDFGNVMIGKPISSYTSRSATLGFFGTTKISTAAQIASSPANLSSPFEFEGGNGFPGSSGTCKPVLDPSVTNACNFVLKLTTTTAGLVANSAVTQAFQVNYAGDGNNGTGSLEFTAKMTPRVPPTLSFTATPSNFGTLAAKDALSQTFTIKNNSPYFSTAGFSATVSGDSAFTIVGNSCGTGLAAGASCNIAIQFKPVAAQAYSATLNVAYNDQIAAQSISAPLNGNGSANVRVAVNGSSTVDFGTVFLGDTIAPRTVALKVYGLETWTPTFSVSAPFAIDASACGAPADCTLTVSYNPLAAGTSNSTVTVSYSPAVNPAANTFNLSLRGVAQSRSASLTVSPLNYKKTLTGTSLEQILTITNSGSGSAQNPAISLPAGAFTVVNDGGLTQACTSGTTLASGQSCRIKVRFAPLQVGAATATLSIGYTNVNLGAAATATATLTGTGTAPIAVYAGAFNTCIINELQQATCWGSNTYGQTGTGSTNALSKTPQQLGKINLGAQAVVRKLAVGAHHVCALVKTPSREGLVTCWGENMNGRLGTGSASPAILTQPTLDGTGYPVAVNFGNDPSTSAPYEAVDLSAGFEHTCAILADGKVKCWGGNSSGQLGIGSTSMIGAASSDMGASLAAVDLKGVAAVSISAGAGHTCAALADGSAKCWGDNFYGQLGTATSVSSIGGAAGEMAALKAISLGNGVSAQSVHASAGAYSCVVLGNGGLKCFGKTAYNENTAQAFFGVLGTCWARANYNAAAVPCWMNSQLPPTGALGYFASDMGDSLPAVSLGGATVSQFAAGDHFGCALLSDKSVRCWGANDRGQLGNGGTSNLGAGQNDLGAALQSSVTGAHSVAAGAEHACAVFDNNTVKCWGGSTENATSLKSYGVTGDVTSPATAPVVYDGTL